MRMSRLNYRYAVSCTYDGRSHYVIFGSIEQARRFVEYKGIDDASICVLSERDFILGLYRKDSSGIWENGELMLNDKELLEKCRTGQPITDEDIGKAKDYINSTKSYGVAIAQNATAGIIDVSKKKDIKVISEYKPHICTEEELRKMKMLQACKERDLRTIQAHLSLGYGNDSLCRMLRERIKEYDRYMYAIKTGDMSGVNLELVTPMGIVDKETRPKESVKSNKEDVVPYDSLLDDEKAERINQCLNKL